MAGTYVFHSKLHRASHHSISATGLPDAGLDPIATKDQPFIGPFYNVLPGISGALTISTNSIQWWSAWSTVNSLSSIWAPTASIYTTVNTLSSGWSLGYGAYTVFFENSSKYESTYSTVRAFSADWNAPFKMFTNQVQEYTAAKTFSGTDLTYDNDTNIVNWNVALNQVTFLFLTEPVTFGAVISAKKGGVYVLNVIQDNIGGHDITFEPSFRFNSTLNLNNVIALEPNSRTIITFVYDGNLMYGHRANYYAP